LIKKVIFTIFVYGLLKFSLLYFVFKRAMTPRFFLLFILLSVSRSIGNLFNKTNAHGSTTTNNHIQPNRATHPSFSQSNISITSNNNNTNRYYIESNNYLFSKSNSHRSIDLETTPATFAMKLVAGTNINGLSGDNGPATSAEIRAAGFWVAPNGNIFIADHSNFVIRKIDPSGIVSYFGGTGFTSTVGTGGAIAAVLFNYPWYIVGDPLGITFYLSDQQYIWKYVFSSNIIAVYAHSTRTPSGFSGDSGLAIDAQLNAPKGIYLTTGGTLYIADSGNHRIRRVIKQGTITTVVGSGCSNSCSGGFSGDQGMATSALLNLPNGVYMDTNGKLFVADLNNNRIRVVDTNSIITTFAGSGLQTPFNDNIAATSANLAGPRDVTGDTLGNIYIADYTHCTVRVVNSAGILSTAIGISSACGYNPGTVPVTSSIKQPYSLQVDSVGTLYVSDYNSIHKIIPTPAPTSQPTGQPSRQPTGQPSRQPVGVPTTQPSRQPSQQPISRPTSQPTRQPSVQPSTQPSAKPSTSLRPSIVGDSFFMQIVAGFNVAGFSGDLPVRATTAFLKARIPWVDASGNIFIPDEQNHRIRKVDTAGIITTFGGTGVDSTAGTAGPITSVLFHNPISMVGNFAGSAWISDQWYVWKYSNVIGVPTTVVAGTTTKGFSGDVGPASLAQLNTPLGLWLTTSGVLYIADYFNHRIRKINTDGFIFTVAGSGTTGVNAGSFTGDGGPAIVATLYGPKGCFMNTAGYLFIADADNNRIRVVNPNNIISTFAGSGVQSPFNGDNRPALSSNIYGPYDVKGDTTGNIYIADGGNCILRMVDISTGILSTLFGTPNSCGYTSGMATRDQVINNVEGIWIDTNSQSSTIYFSDYNAIHRSVTVSSPSSQPSGQPSRQPVTRPSAQPTRQPSSLPSRQPSGQPSSEPSSPSSRPSRKPSSQPSRKPTGQPSQQPLSSPTTQPTKQPLSHPSSSPSRCPSTRPSSQPSSRPTVVPKPTLPPSTILYTENYAGYSIAPEGLLAVDSFTENPRGIWENTLGDLYFTDIKTCTLKKIDHVTSKVTTIVGKGFPPVNPSLPVLPMKGREYQPETPFHVQGDTLGNLYLLDNGLSTVIKVFPDNSLFVYGTGASSPTVSLSGAEVFFRVPERIWVDTAGAIYILDCPDSSTPNRITQLSQLPENESNVTRVFEQLAAPDGGGLLDISGWHEKLFFTDDGRQTIQYIDLSDSSIQTIQHLRFTNAGSLFTYNYELYIFENGDNMIYFVPFSGGNWGTKIPIAGGGSSVIGPSLLIGFPTFHDLWGDSQRNLYWSENDFILKRNNTTLMVSTITGIDASNRFRGENSPATEAVLKSPASITGDSNGNIYFYDSGNQKIRKIDTNDPPRIHTLQIANFVPNSLVAMMVDNSGNNLIIMKSTAGPLKSVSLSSLTVSTIPGVTSINSFWIDALNNLYLIPNARQINFYDQITKTQTLVAGNLTVGPPTAEGSAALDYRFGEIFDITGDINTQTLYVIDAAGLIRSVYMLNGVRYVKTLLQSNGQYELITLRCDISGNLYMIANAHDANQVFHLSYDSGTNSYQPIALVGNGGPPETYLEFSNGVANQITMAPQFFWINSIKEFYISDRDYNMIRKVYEIDSPTSQPSGHTSGLPTDQPTSRPSSHPTERDHDIPFFTENYAGYSVAPEYLAATESIVRQPRGIWGNSNGDVFFTDRWTATLKKVDFVTGLVTTIVGNGMPPSSPVNTSAISYMKANEYQPATPNQVIGDTLGNLYLLDMSNGGVITKVFTDNSLLVYGRGSQDPAGGLSVTSVFFTSPQSLWVDSNGALYVLDSQSTLIIDRISVVSHSSAQPLIVTTVYYGLTDPAGDGMGSITGSDYYLYFDILADQIYRLDLRNNSVEAVPDVDASQVNVFFAHNFNLYYFNYVAAQLLKVPFNVVTGSWGALVTLAGDNALGEVTGEPSQISFTDLYSIWADTLENLYWSQDDYLMKFDRTADSVDRFVGIDPANRFVGDNSPATLAVLDIPTAITGDTNGNIYFFDSYNARIRKIDHSSPHPKIHTVSGTGGATIIAMEADPFNNLILLEPSGVLKALSLSTFTVTLFISVTSTNSFWMNTTDGNFYLIVGGSQIAHFGRRGTFTVVAGTGAAGAAIDGPALLFSFPADILDITGDVKTGALYFTDGYNIYTYYYDGTDYVIKTMYSSISNPISTIRCDRHGTVFVSDATSDMTIFQLKYDNVQHHYDLKPVIGSGEPHIGPRFLDPTNGLAREINMNPMYFWINSLNEFYISDPDYSIIRKAMQYTPTALPTGPPSSAPSLQSSFNFQIENFIGKPGREEGSLATQTLFFQALALWGDSVGNLYYTEPSSCSIRRLGHIGHEVTTVVGNLFCSSETSQARYNEIISWTDEASGISLSDIIGLTGDAQGNLYFSFAQYHTIMKYNPQNGLMSRWTGSFTQGFHDDVPLNALFASPQGVWVNTATRDLWIADINNHAVRLYNYTMNRVTTITQLTTSTFLPYAPYGTKDMIYVTDLQDDGYIMALNLTSKIVYPVSDTCHTCLGLFVDSSGTLFVTSYNDNIIYNHTKTDGSLNTHLYAGNLAATVPKAPHPVNSMPITSGWLIKPNGLWGNDQTNVLYVAQKGQISIIDRTTSTVVLEVGIYMNGDGGLYPPNQAILSEPSALWGDTMGNMYVAEGNHIRVYNHSTNTISTTKKLTNSNQILAIQGAKDTEHVYFLSAANTFSYYQLQTQTVVPMLDLNAYDPLTFVIDGLDSTRFYFVGSFGTMIFSYYSTEEEDPTPFAGAASPPVNRLLTTYSRNCSFASVFDLYSDSKGDIYLIDDLLIRKIYWKEERRFIKHIGGGGTVHPSATREYRAEEVAFGYLVAITVDEMNERIYLSDSKAGRVFQMYYENNDESQYFVTILAGSGAYHVQPLSANLLTGNSLDVSLQPGDIWTDNNRIVYFIDAGLQVVMKVYSVAPTSFPTNLPSGLPSSQPTKELTAFPSSEPSSVPTLSSVLNLHIQTVIGKTGYEEHSEATQTVFSSADTMWGDQSDNLYYVEGPHCSIRKVSAGSFLVSTIVGTQACLNTMSYNDLTNYKGSPRAISLPAIGGLTGDVNGYLYFSLPNKHVIMKYSMITDQISFFLGSSTAVDGGSDGLPMAVSFNQPLGLWIDPSSNDLWIADNGNFKLRRFDRNTNRVLTMTFADLTFFPLPAVIIGDPKHHGNVYFTSQSSPRVYYYDSNTKAVTPVINCVCTCVGLFVDSNGTVFASNGIQSTGSTHGLVYSLTLLQTLFSSEVYVGGGNSQLNSSVSVPLRSAFLSVPTAIWGNNAKNQLFVAQQKQISVINTLSGTIRMFLGLCADGDGGPGNQAFLESPMDIWGDSLGNIYTAEFQGDLRYYDPVTQQISTLTITEPGTIAMKGDNNGSLCYLAENDHFFCVELSSNNFIVDVPLSQSASTFCFDGLLGQEAIYFVVDEGHQINLWTTATPAVLQPFAGGRGPDVEPTTTTAAMECFFSSIQGLASDVSGNIFVVESTMIRLIFLFRGDYQIQWIGGFGNIDTPIAGRKYRATDLKFDSLIAIAVDHEDRIYVSDMEKFMIYQLVYENSLWYLSVFAGTGVSPGLFDIHNDILVHNSLQTNIAPGKLWVDYHQKGVVYFLDNNLRIVRKVFAISDPTSSPSQDPSAQPTAKPSGFPSGQPSGLPSFGEHFPSSVPSSFPTLVFNPDFTVQTIVGQTGYEEDAFPSETVTRPISIWGDTNGNLFFVEDQICSIRTLTAESSKVSTVVGTKVCNFAMTYSELVELNNARTTNLPSIWGLYGDSSGSLYFSLNNKHVIMKYFPDTKEMRVLLGAGDTSGRDGIALEASFNSPLGLFVDNNGNIYVSDSNNYAVRYYSKTIDFVLTLSLMSPLWANSPPNPAAVFVVNMSSTEQILYFTDTSNGFVYYWTINSQTDEVAPYMVCSMGYGLWVDENVVPHKIYCASENGIMAKVGTSDDGATESYPYVGSSSGLLGLQLYIGDSLGIGDVSLSFPYGIRGNAEGNALYIIQSNQIDIVHIQQETISYVLGIPNPRINTLASLAYFNMLTAFTTDKQGKLYIADAPYGIRAFSALTQQVEVLKISSTFVDYYIGLQYDERTETLLALTSGKSLYRIELNNFTMELLDNSFDYIFFVIDNRNPNTQTVYTIDNSRKFLFTFSPSIGKTSKAHFAGVTGLGSGWNMITDRLLSEAPLHRLQEIWLDPWNDQDIYVVDSNTIRKIYYHQADGQLHISIIAGNGPILDSIRTDIQYPASAVGLLHPWSITGDLMGNMYFSDTGYLRIFKINQDPLTEVYYLRVFAGTGESTNVLEPTFVRNIFQANINPGVLAVDNQGNLYMADRKNNVIRQFLVPQPTQSPSRLPSVSQTRVPTKPPSRAPSRIPTVTSTMDQPTGQPSDVPSSDPSNCPSNFPSSLPSILPSTQPTSLPSGFPSSSPNPSFTSSPTIFNPVATTKSPSLKPTVRPTGVPSATSTTFSPSVSPSRIPSESPIVKGGGEEGNGGDSSVPSVSPSNTPTELPTESPSVSPTRIPSLAANESYSPTTFSSSPPSFSPSFSPSVSPSSPSSSSPSLTPSNSPTTSLPTLSPSLLPTSCSPSVQPSFVPSSRLPTPIRTNKPSTFLPTREDVTYLKVSNPGRSVAFQQMNFLFGRMNTEKQAFRDIVVPVATSSNNQLGNSILSYIIFGGPKDTLIKQNSNSSVIDLQAEENTNSPVVLVSNEFPSLLTAEDSSVAGSRSFALISDMNNDSFVDLLIGDPVNSQVYLLFGNGFDLYSLDNGCVIKSASASANAFDYLGWAVAGGSTTTTTITGNNNKKVQFDFNGDGLNDMIMSALNTGMISILYGRNTAVSSSSFPKNLFLSSLTASEGLIVKGSTSTASNGMAVSSAGDFNGDSFDDLFFSGMTISNAVQGNVIYLLFGGKQISSLGSILKIDDLLSSQSHWLIKIIAPSWSFAGMSLSWVGDINGDRLDDLVIGSVPYRGRYVTQESYLVYGRVEWSSQLLLFSDNEVVTMIGGGFMVSGVGDLDNDGFNDLLVIGYEGWQGQSGSYLVQSPLVQSGDSDSSGSGVLSRKPTVSPTVTPSLSPSFTPSFSPSSASPTETPTISFSPSLSPTITPSGPSQVPSFQPSRPTASPSLVPTRSPSRAPTVLPTAIPTMKPSNTNKPTSLRPSLVFLPSLVPSFRPSRKPTVSPSVTGSHAPSLSASPTIPATPLPTILPPPSTDSGGHKDDNEFFSNNTIINRGGEYQDHYNLTALLLKMKNTKTTTTATPFLKLVYIIDSSADVKIIRSSASNNQAHSSNSSIDVIHVYSIKPQPNMMLTIVPFLGKWDVIDLTAFATVSSSSTSRRRLEDQVITISSLKDISYQLNPSLVLLLPNNQKISLPAVQESLVPSSSSSSSSTVFPLTESNFLFASPQSVPSPSLDSITNVRLKGLAYLTSPSFWTNGLLITLGLIFLLFALTFYCSHMESATKEMEENELLDRLYGKGKKDKDEHQNDEHDEEHGLLFSPDNRNNGKNTLQRIEEQPIVGNSQQPLQDNKSNKKNGTPLINRANDNSNRKSTDHSKERILSAPSSSSSSLEFKSSLGDSFSSFSYDEQEEELEFASLPHSSRRVSSTTSSNSALDSAPLAMDYQDDDDGDEDDDYDDYKDDQESRRSDESNNSDGSIDQDNGRFYDRSSNDQYDLSESSDSDDDEADESDQDSKNFSR
jgi:sugar lactone lactonase YvrE